MNAEAGWWLGGNLNGLWIGAYLAYLVPRLWRAARNRRARRRYLAHFKARVAKPGSIIQTWPPPESGHLIVTMPVGGGGGGGGRRLPTSDGPGGDQ